MRCPDCNKFVPYRTDTEPEIEVDIDELEITGTCRIVLTCEECDTELKEANLDISIQLADEIEGLPEKYTVISGEVEMDDSEMTQDAITGEYVTPKRGPNKGKSIYKAWSPRYHKQFYGARATLSYTVEVKPEGGGDAQTFKGTVEWSDQTQASNMDELT